VGQYVGLHQQLDASRDTWLAPDQPLAFEREQHLMDGRRRDAEVALQVSLGWRPAEYQRVGMDKRQVLPLLRREAR